MLELTPAENTSLHVTGRKVDCPPEKNLVMKALRALETATGGIPPTRIHLHKIIPDGAGLGGGSADAAFTLLGLNRLYDLGLSGPDLMKIAAGIGADCPFFIHNRPMLATGTGTTLTPVEPPLEGLCIAIAKPEGKSVSTAEAYAGVRPAGVAVRVAEAAVMAPDSWHETLHNDFEPSVGAHIPEIYALKQHMFDAGAFYSAMSGSGSAVFGLFRSDKMAENAIAALKDCACWSGRLMPQAQ